MANLRVDKITSTETFETTGSVQFDGSGDHLDVDQQETLITYTTIQELGQQSFGCVLKWKFKANCIFYWRK